MKQINVLTVVLLLLLESQSLNAGQVTDSFSTGDILTDTKLQKIKAAINDNDNNAAANAGNIVFNGANITSNANLISTLHNLPVPKPVVSCSPAVLSSSLVLSTVVDVTSVSVTVNGGGLVMVSANAIFSASDSGGATSVDWAAGLYVTDTSSISSGMTVSWEVPVGSLPGNYSVPAHVQGLFRVDTAGTYTYYFTGAVFKSSSTINVSAVMSTLCATFTPD